VVIASLFVWLALTVPRLQLKAFDQAFALVRDLYSYLAFGVLQKALNSKNPIAYGRI
jgi:hypothetical protein